MLRKTGGADTGLGKTLGEGGFQGPGQAARVQGTRLRGRTESAGAEGELRVKEGPEARGGS